MTKENSGRSFKASLRQELVNAAGRRIERRRKVKKAAVAGVWVAVIAVGGVGLLTAAEDRSAEAGVLTVQSDGPDLLVNITDETADPDQVRRDLEANGIVAEVTPVPVPPALVGKFVGTAVDSSQGVELVARQDNASDSFRLAKGSKTRLDLALGRPAQPNEDYYVSVNAYRAGNALACSDLWGKQASDAIAFANIRGFNLSFEAPGNPSLLEGSAHGFVTDAVQLSENKVMITLSDTTQSPFIQSEGPIRDGCPN